MTLKERCTLIQNLFYNLQLTDSRLDKEAYVKQFRKDYPELVRDLDYCFEVLAGGHKIGYTLLNIPTHKESLKCASQNYTIESLVNTLKAYPCDNASIISASYYVPLEVRPFIVNLVNREYKLGYSNKERMIDITSPMLAKKYPDSVHEQMYFIQEKLDGNRCIAFYSDDYKRWVFKSRSNKLLNVNFDMSWARKTDIFDGEIMTLNHAGSRDFNKTSGAINGLYTDKSQLHYYIYDIIDTLPYSNRKLILDEYDEKGTGTQCSILPVLDKLTVYVNPDYNGKLDEWLDYITSKGGEGIMLRDPAAEYQCGKRSDALLKYKKTQTMDLRIIGINEGKGKYEGAIGSFICETDDHKIKVNVAGMNDDIRWSDKDSWIGKIIEVAYFDNSQSKTKLTSSLRFPRMKKVRDDKDTTSIY